MRYFLGFLATSTAVALAVPAQAADTPHRDDFVMNSIGGGDFRGYILDHISEGEALYQPMRTFGTVHNVMHQLMTELATHARDDMEDEHVPDFSDRVSGGDWSAYREALEDAGEDGDWAELVQFLEIMHDRVHHAMYKAVIYDQQAMGRDADVLDYVRDPKDASVSELLPDRDRIDATFMPLEEFRTALWEDQPEDRHWRAATQSAMVFAQLENQLTQQWIQYATDHKTGACQPQIVGQAMQEDWAGYVDQIVECDDAEWRELVQAHDLAQLHIHQALDHIARHHGES